MEIGLPEHVRTALQDAPSSATGVLFVDLAALRRNYRRLKALAPGARVAAVIKANAYGLGALEVFDALSREGCESFFVATLDEAKALRAVWPGRGIIFVLDGLFPGTGEEFVANALSPVLGSLAEVEEWIALCQRQSHWRQAALHLDTGMTRLGLPPDEAETVLRRFQARPPFNLQLVMTHLACADDPKNPKNGAQLESFHRLLRLAPHASALSIANSAGIFLGAKYHKTLVRAGIALYGGRAALAGQNPMEPVVSLFGRIAQVRWAERGETVGYGAAQTLKARARIATVAVGYADGFFRAVSASDAREGPPGYIGDSRVPLLGRVSMDLITYDVTSVPDTLACRGGWIELLGQRVTVDDFAGFAGTIGYEVLTSLGRRHHRIFLDEQE
jgi:alanine racemase